MFQAQAQTTDTAALPGTAAKVNSETFSHPPQSLHSGLASQPAPQEESIRAAITAPSRLFSIAFSNQVQSKQYRE